jgi:O-antigen/teichoic acid export membrane protein
VTAGLMQDAGKSGKRVPIIPRSEKPRSRTMAAWVLLNASLVCKVAANLWLVRFSLDHLGAEQYAVWVTLQSIMLYLLASEMGLGQTVMNWTGEAFARGKHDRVNDVLTSGFGFYWAIVSVVWIAFSAVVLLFPVKPLLFGSNASQVTMSVALCLWLLGTLTLARLPFVAFSAALGGLRELPARQWQEIASQAGLVGATYCVLRAGGQLLGLAVGVGVVLLAIGVAGYEVVTRRHTWVRISRAHWRPSLLGPMFTDSIFFFLSTIALMVQRSAGSLLAARYATLAEVPVVFAVFLLIRVLGTSVADGVSRVLQPYVIMFWGREEYSRVRFFGALSTKVTFGVAVVFGSILSLFGSDILQFWIGRRGAGDERFINLLLLAFAIDMLFLPATNFIWVIGRHRRLAVVMGVYAITTVVFGAAGVRLVREAPLIGMAVGFLSATVIVQVVWMPLTIVQALQIDWREYIQNWVVRPLALSLPAACWIVLARLVPIDGIAARTELAAALVASVGLVGWSVALNAEERNSLKGIMNRGVRAAPSTGLGLA